MILPRGRDGRFLPDPIRELRQARQALSGAMQDLAERTQSLYERNNCARSAIDESWVTRIFGKSRNHSLFSFRDRAANA